MEGLNLLCNLLAEEQPIQNNSIKLNKESYLKAQIAGGNNSCIHELILFYVGNDHLFQALPYYGLAFKIFPNEPNYVKGFIENIKPNSNNLELVISYLERGFETGNSECMVVAGNLCFSAQNYNDMKKYYNMAIAFNRTDALTLLIEYYLKYERANRSEYIQNLLRLVGVYQKMDISNQNTNAHKFQRYKLAVIDFFKEQNDIPNIIICHKVGIENNHTQSYLDLIEYYLYVEKNKNNAKQLVIEMYERNKREYFIDNIVLTYMEDESKYEMFELLCMIGVSFKNIFCMQKLGIKALQKQNYHCAFVCNLGIILNTENTSSQVLLDSVSAISNIICSIKINILNPKTYFEVLSNNIDFLKDDIPPTHKVIIQEIKNVLDYNIKYYSQNF